MDLGLIRIDYLKHHQSCIPRLADLFWQEWQQFYEATGRTAEQVTAYMRAKANTDSIPLALVAVYRSQVIGTGAIKPHDLDIRPQFSPWLAGLYVLREFRDNGVGSLLVARLLEEARQLGLSELYLWTPSAERLYSRLGWSLLERTQYCDQWISIMKKELNR
ncbi:MAG: GNAT family N-acetyltransferase [Phycisphaerales bacterium]|nr:MAG: GNAT family N-acetyltransferase [Phycisphaerales bacterium]